VQETVVVVVSVLKLRLKVIVGSRWYGKEVRRLGDVSFRVNLAVEISRGMTLAVEVNKPKPLLFTVRRRLWRLGTTQTPMRLQRAVHVRCEGYF
jgi:hypothetical protein